jgi:hypothetical protein
VRGGGSAECLIIDVLSPALACPPEIETHSTVWGDSPDGMQKRGRAASEPLLPVRYWHIPDDDADRSKRQLALMQAGPHECAMTRAAVATKAEQAKERSKRDNGSVTGQICVQAESVEEVHSALAMLQANEALLSPQYRVFFDSASRSNGPDCMLIAPDCMPMVPSIARRCESLQRPRPIPTLVSRAPSPSHPGATQAMVDVHWLRRQAGERRRFLLQVQPVHDALVLHARVPRSAQSGAQARVWREHCDTPWSAHQRTPVSSHFHGASGFLHRQILPNVQLPGRGVAYWDRCNGHRERGQVPREGRGADQFAREPVLPSQSAAARERRGWQRPVWLSW